MSLEVIYEAVLNGDAKTAEAEVQAALEANIPAHLRDPHNRWFGLSKRARILAVAKDRVAVGAITRPGAFSQESLG